MVAKQAPPTQSTDRPEAGRTRRGWIAVGLGWLLPGLGHVYLGRFRQGLLFGAIIWSAFSLGLANDGRLALRDERQPLLTGLQIVANLGVGPADMVARRWVYGELAYRLPNEQARGADEQRAEIFRERARSGVSIYGTAYLWTAGLMNLLLLFDVWDIGRGRNP